ncbi:uncharacterized protein LOC109830495 [Asparagus officinalis]|uniref:uncharacterized protein LOC109830495 n=1 Tax=Asparagus officinalis TaxID=4686 RepID=UPI00098E4296|nr:uncharacterized protein LOC109830495 [Asparagus officinalis]
MDSHCPCANIIKAVLSECCCTKAPRRVSVFERISTRTPENKPRRFRRKKPVRQEDEFLEVSANMTGRGKSTRHSSSDQLAETSQHMTRLRYLIRRSDNVNPYYEAEEQPFHVLESIYRDCWRNFNIEDNPVGWEFLFGYIGKFKHSLREWRHEIKKKCFDCFTHNWERIYKRNKRVEPEHLAILIVLWGQEEHQKKCQRNKLNRWKKDYDHHTGTTSFAQIEDQFCRIMNAPFIPLPELHGRTMVHFRKGYDDNENKKQKLELAKKMQEALENTYAEVVAQSQEPLTRE